jgi:nucleotide-binding universal stress UspA family protein
MSDYPILVGYDGSLCAGAALRWAQDEAVRRSAPVRLVYVYEWATDVAPVPLDSTWPDPDVRQDAVRAVEEAVNAARSAQPDVPVTGSVVDGPTVSTLRKLAEDARLLAIGSRGLGGFPGLLAGSVATGMAANGHCPVVIVRGCARATRPVAVGVDDSDDSDHAVGFAFDQAASRGVGLLAVRAWQPAPVPRPEKAGPPRFDAGALAAAERHRTESALRLWQEKYPHVPVQLRLVRDHAAPALVSASHDAQLLVVGAHGRGGSRGVVLGSAARQLSDHAHCPVAIVRDSADWNFERR